MKYITMCSALAFAAVATEGLTLQEEQLFTKLEFVVRHTWLFFLSSFPTLPQITQKEKQA